jgi:hypothetical protein
LILPKITQAVVEQETMDAPLIRGRRANNAVFESWESGITICPRCQGSISRWRPIRKTLESELPESEKTLSPGSRTLKLFLVSCLRVTVRIHGLASPLLAKAITVYGRHVLRFTWDMAKETELKPKYGDTDSVFLDNPPRDDVERFVESLTEYSSVALYETGRR